LFERTPEEKRRTYERRDLYVLQRQLQKLFSSLGVEYLLLLSFLMAWQHVLRRSGWTVDIDHRATEEAATLLFATARSI
jgi:hypothetical protein